MLLPHRLLSPTGLVASAADGGLPGGTNPNPASSAGPSFQKPEGSLHQPLPPAGSPGGPVLEGGTLELSGWWRRVGATVLDGLILMIPFIPMALIVISVFGVSIGFSEPGEADEAGILGAIALFLLLGAVYFVIALIYAPFFMARWNGATPGKKALGIRVVRANGMPMDFGYAAYREVLVKQLLFTWILGSFTAGLSLLIDYLWPLWDSEERALHDMIVNTRVVRA